MTKTKIAIVAALATLVAVPAFAMDNEVAGATINSGRYLPELNLWASSVRVPTKAFASAQPGRVQMNRAQAIAPAGGYDFQLQGRGLGE